MSSESQLPSNGKLIESIKVLDGKIHNLYFHKKRMAEAIPAVYGCSPAYELDDLDFDTKRFSSGLYKLRVLYNAQSYSHEFVPYLMKPKANLKLVFDDEISYSYKSIDRAHLSSLFAKRNDCDDIIIIKNNMLTDSYYCNLALEKDGRWYTPALPLLLGTKRAQLLAEEQLIETNIFTEDLYKYSRVRLFNAMIEFGECEIALSQIR